MADSGGARRNFRLSVPVEAGPVVIAVEGHWESDRALYRLETTLVVGYLENPGADSFQSGIGVLSGWVCAADLVEIELNGVPQAASYGTERVDTADICGDTDNGFGLLFNWNLLGDGEHEVVAFVDGIELARATVTVTTLGAEFLRDVEGTCEVTDFPTGGARRCPSVWQESAAELRDCRRMEAAGGDSIVPGIAGVGYLENPGPQLLSEWGGGALGLGVCSRGAVELAIGTWPRKWRATAPSGWIPKISVGTQTTGLGCCSTGTCWATGSTQSWPT